MPLVNEGTRVRIRPIVEVDLATLDRWRRDSDALAGFHPPLIDIQTMLKAANVGFDWPEVTGVIDKIKEELQELEKAISDENPEELENELGDMLFSLVNLARYHRVSAEDCLRSTINKFIARFQYIERKLKERQKSIYHSSLEEMDQLWEESKSQIN